MLLGALLFAMMFGFGVVGLLFTKGFFQKTPVKKIAFTVAWGAVTVVTYGVFLIMIWPAG
jgi:hypothetical protein